MVTSSDNDDFDEFMRQIEEASKDLLGPKREQSWHYKSVKCFMCRDEVVVLKGYALNETCPKCYAHWRFVYVKGPVGQFPNTILTKYITCVLCKNKDTIPLTQVHHDLCISCYKPWEAYYIKKNPPRSRF